MDPRTRIKTHINHRARNVGKKTNFDIVLESIKKDLKRDYELYDEALRGVIAAKDAGGDPTAWLTQMDDLVHDKPFAEMSHEGVKFLLEEMVRDFLVVGWRAPVAMQVQV